MAFDTGCLFKRISTPTLVNEYQGSGAQNVKREIDAALALADSAGKKVVISFEEIDAIAKIGANDRNTKTEESATQALWLIFDQYKGDPRIFFILNTNHFKDLNATLRNRFQDAYLVEFNNPDKKMRRDIIEMYAQADNLNFSAVLNISEAESKRFMQDMAERSNTMSIRAIENMVHSMKIHAEYEKDPKRVTRAAFMKILEESKRKNAETKNSKKEWEKADEWTERVSRWVSTTSYTISLPRTIQDTAIAIVTFKNFVSSLFK